MYIKSEVEEIFFKLATNDHSDEAFLLTFKILALMGCLPLPKGYVYTSFPQSPLILTYPQHSGERYRTNGRVATGQGKVREI